MTQGEIGYLLQQALTARRPVAADGDRAHARARGRGRPGVRGGPDQADRRLLRRGRGAAPGRASAAGTWRPTPAAAGGAWSPARGRCGSSRSTTCAALAEGGVLVIAAGGGGIPVAWRDGQLVGLDAVIDKDRCAAELALALRGRHARAAHRRAARARSTSARRRRARRCGSRVSDALRHLEEGEFPPGAWGRRSRAPRASSSAGRQRRDRRRRAPAPPRCAGTHGTWIVPDAEGPSVFERRRRWRHELAGPHARRDRYADSVRLMGIARALRERDGVRGVRGRRWARRPTSSALAALGAERRRAARRRRHRGRRRGRPGRRGAGRGRAPAGRRRRRRATPSAGRRARARWPRRASCRAPTSRSSRSPGEYAALEAHRALTRGLHVFLFSDHVSLDDEVALKRRGARARPARHGPRVRHRDARRGRARLRQRRAPGPVGIVAAAGTGAQEVACLLDAAGGGVSHIIGVGGRDLSTEVGGHRCSARASRCSRATRRPRRCCWWPSRQPRGRSSAGRRGRPRACGWWPRSWAGRASCPAGRSTRRSRPRRCAAAARDGARRRPARGRSARAGAASSACTPAARWPTRRASCSSRWLGAGGHRARGGRRRRPRRSSTSATRRTPRAARTRWSTSASACELLEAAAADGRTAACCSTSCCGHGAHPDPACELAGAVARAAAARDR